MQKIKLYRPGDVCPRCDNRLIADGIELDEVFCLSGHRYLSPHRARRELKMQVEAPELVAIRVADERPVQAVIDSPRRFRAYRNSFGPTGETDERERSSRLALELLAS
jgi:hypothetical protein